jgi:hypothetical protein
MEAPSGLAFQLSLPYAGGAGLIQPAGLARPQQGFSPPEAKMERSRNPGKGSTYLRTAINPVCAFAVGLMEIEK